MFRDLYMISFPVFEQRTDEQQDDAFSCLNYHLNAYAEDGCFIGFISYWEFSDYIYIEHFAINQSLRGKDMATGFCNVLYPKPPKWYCWK